MTTSGERAAVPTGTAPRCLRVLVADPDPAAAEVYRQALAAFGDRACVAGTGREAIELFRALGPDVVVTEASLPDMSGSQLLAAIGRERDVPVVVTSAGTDPTAGWPADCHVLGWLAKPFRAEALGAAVATAARCFDRIRALEGEVAEVRRALEDRKLIERAKGAAMRYAGLSEDEAYRRMRRLATDRGQKLVEVARAVLAAAEVFAELAAGRPGPGDDGPATRPGRTHLNGTPIANPAGG